MIKILLLIGTGSFIGGVLRFLVSHSFPAKSLSLFPWPTLTVNILGCFLIGCVFAGTERFNLAMEWRVFLATGFLGGFTTFSAFSYETVTLLRNGYFAHAAGYVILSVLVGLTATLLGYWILRSS